MSAPRTKRQFAGDSAQRSITAYFTPSGTCEPTPTSASSSASHATTGYPALPASVQTGLINVGMRVRKSVPEGYKTGSEPYGSFKLWAADGTPTNPTTTTMATTTAQHITTATAAAAQPINLPKAASRPNELLPFCGIHKVGGLAAQIISADDDDDDDDDDGLPALDDVPKLSYSQESTSSAVGDDSWGGRASRKRFISDQDEEDMRRGLTDETLMDAHLGTTSPVASRTIALPRRRKADAATPAFNVRFRGGGGNDFEDAEFLNVDAFGEARH